MDVLILSLKYFSLLLEIWVSHQKHLICTTSTFYSNFNLVRVVFNPYLGIQESNVHGKSPWKIGLDHDGNVIDFPASDDISLSFKDKKVVGNDGYFWRNLEMQVINLKIDYILTWFENSVLKPSCINGQI